jgi:FkbM family methyltransferase
MIYYSGLTGLDGLIRGSKWEERVGISSRKRLRTNIRIILEKILGSSLTEFAYVYYKHLEFHMDKQLPQEEQKLLKEISQHIQPGTTVLDIGSFLGAWARKLSKVVGSSGRVLAFEPFPSNFDLLRKLCKKYQNINVYNFALSDKSCILEMLSPPEVRLTPISAIKCSADQFDNERKIEMQKTDVNACCLDDIVCDLSIPKISFMKIDVEGHELQVVRGAEKTLVEHKPIITLEILQEKWVEGNPLLSEVGQFLISLGYKMGQFIDDKIVYSNTFSRRNENFVLFPKHP